MSMSSHFIVFCRVYPSFSFVVQKLRKLRKDQGETFPSGVVHFEHGTLNTKTQGFTEEEAALIFEKISTRESRPIWGTDIFPPGESATGLVPDGKLRCPVCKQTFDSPRGLANHLTKHDEPAKAVAA